MQRFVHMLIHTRKTAFAVYLQENVHCSVTSQCYVNTQKLLPTLLNSKSLMNGKGVLNAKCDIST